MYRLIKAFNMIRSKALHSFIRRNAKKIGQVLLSKEKRRFYLAFKKRDHHKTIEAGSKLLPKEANNPEFLRAYSLSLARAGNSQEGKHIMRDALNAIDHCSYENIIKYSQRTFKSTSTIETKHLLLGGYTNYGFLKHTITNNDSLETNWITKITQFESRTTNYEHRFYLEISQKHPELIPIAPKLEDYIMIPQTKVELLTTEFIECDPTAKHDLNQVIKINKVIESISYKEALAIFSDIEMKVGRYVPSLLHQKSINLEAILDMKRTAEKTAEKQILVDLVNHIESMILGQKLYKKVQPEIHYAFSHQDFHWKNVIVQKDTGKHYVIDWNNIGIAMRGWDMNYFFNNFQYSFAEIEEYYISTIHFTDPIDEKVAKIYFAFLQVYIWIKRLRRHPIENKLETHFVPAVEFMESIYSDLMEEIK